MFIFDKAFPIMGKVESLPWGLYYKTLRICNLWETDKFRSKLASSGLDQHTSLDKHTILDKHIVLDKHTSLGKQAH